MDIDQYDAFGRTRLMNAAIEGNLDQVKRLLELGADPDIADENWSTSRAVDYARRLANNSAVHKRIVELLSPDKNSKGRVNDERGSAKVIASHSAAHHTGSSWPYETVRMMTGNHVTRLRSSLFYWGGTASFITGVILLSRESLSGGFLVLTLTPFLLLYPLIRFLFGGKDSLAAVVTTVVVEELLKQQIQKAVNKSSKRRK